MRLVSLLQRTHSIHPPRSIKKVVMIENDRYDPIEGRGIAHLKNPVKLKEWTPEEWEKDKDNYIGYSINEF